jgi:hypothetical protein
MTVFSDPPRSSERLIAGAWTESDGAVASDEAARRIDWLVNQYLKRIGDGGDGRTTLYPDPADGRYWELTYPLSELHGGGPPQLAAISPTDASRRYALDDGR